MQKEEEEEEGERTKGEKTGNAYKAKSQGPQRVKPCAEELGELEDVVGMCIQRPPCPLATAKKGDPRYAGGDSAAAAEEQ